MSSSNYSVDDGNGTNLCGGLTREAATREAQQHANRTGLACLVYGEGYEKCIEPEDADDAEPDVAAAYARALADVAAADTAYDAARVALAAAAAATDSCRLALVDAAAACRLAAECARLGALARQTGRSSERLEHARAMLVAPEHVALAALADALRDAEKELAP